MITPIITENSVASSATSSEVWAPYSRRRKRSLAELAVAAEHEERVAEVARGADVRRLAHVYFSRPDG